MKKLSILLALVTSLCAATAATGAFAGEAGTTGTVNAVDPVGRTVNLTHGPIEALGWPGMTMDFAVLPSVDLGTVKVGEAVSFTVGQTPEGAYAIDTLTPAH